MEKPVLSPDFTMEDLYKLREYNSLRYSKMTSEEIIADIRKGAQKGLAKMEQIRKEKASA